MGALDLGLLGVPLLAPIQRPRRGAPRVAGGVLKRRGLRLQGAGLALVALVGTSGTSGASGTTCSSTSTQ